MDIDLKAMTKFRWSLALSILLFSLVLTGIYTQRCGSNANFRDVLNLDKTKTGSNWLDRWMEESVWNNCQSTSTRYRNADHDEKSDKILEVDTWRPHLDPQRSTRSFQLPRHVLASDYHNQSFATFDSPSKRSTKPPSPAPNLSSLEVLSMSHLNYPIEKDEITLRSSGNSPQPLSASSRPGSNSGRRGPFTPAKSDRSWGYFSAYSSHPNYMANTESSRAKVRSQSAPRQRLELEKFSASKRSAQGYWDGWTHSDSNMVHDSDLRSTAYPFNHMDRYGSATLR